MQVSQLICTLLYPFYTTCCILSTLQTPHVAATATKNRSVGSSSEEYYDNLNNRLPADFLSRVLSFKKALSQSLTKPQIMTLFYVVLVGLVSFT